MMRGKAQLIRSGRSTLRQNALAQLREAVVNMILAGGV
jgi:hypothetical protein